ncbi:MAG: hypothetical protein FWG65_11585 [Turicibacter sp.]|nr:hypothetical protein [Turicibacter sp.]
MFSRKNQRKNRLKIGLIVLVFGIAAAIVALLIFTNLSLIGHWEMVDMRGTSERIERLPAAQRVMLERYFDERLEREEMEIEFFDDGTGLITLRIDEVVEIHQFQWTATDGFLNKRIGIMSMDMEYSLSLTRLTLITPDEDDGIIREFRRTSR